MTLDFGLRTFVVHLATDVDKLPRGIELVPSASRLGLLCCDAGEKLQGSTLNTWTEDRAAVTCSSCIEWMHA